MKFGTPLSPAAIRVMLLGSGELGKEVVIELQRLGVETIAVDRYANAPAAQVAHRAHVIDMTDAKALRAVVEKEREILSAAARQEGKPENIIAKMVEGRLRNFYSERVLLEQPFVKDDKKTVGQLAKEAKLTIKRLVHWELGK